MAVRVNSGVVAVNSPITNSGSPNNASLGLDYSALLVGLSTRNLSVLDFSASILTADNVTADALNLTAGGSLTAQNDGGVLSLTLATAQPSNPGTGVLALYVRNGTNANTLKLTVRAGTAAEVTVLDNIPQ